MKNPNLFIVGAARSGTTSLWHYLKSCPEIFMPEDLMSKEPAFFSEFKKTRFRKWEDYLRLFAEADESHRLVGEASTAYLTDPGSAKQICNYNPSVRVIIILRNPAYRAYSLYNWMVQQGYEYADPFERALYLENYRIRIRIPNYYEPEYYYNYLYFNSGLFYEQVKRYRELFGRNVLILKHENYVKDRNNELEKVCRFLEIEALPAGDDCRNNSVRVESSIAQFILRKLTVLWLSLQKNKNSISLEDLTGMLLKKSCSDLEALKNMTYVSPNQENEIKKLVINIAMRLFAGELKVTKGSLEGRDQLMRTGYVNNKKQEKIKKSTLSFLKQKYKPDVHKLSEYTGIDFTDWIN